MLSWNKGWQCLFEAITSLKEEDLTKKVLIRNEEHSIFEAINRQLTHYAYHVGQIVYLGKMIQNEQWNSLSIPKGESEKYNSEKLSFKKRTE